jgi:hypothetical protein
LLGVLLRLLKRTGAKVILSSTWRIDPVGRFATKHYRIPVHDCCPDMLTTARPGDQTLAAAASISVKRFVVIDDEANELDSLPLFQPSGKTGLTAKIANGIERYLNGETDRTMRGSVAKRLFQDISSRLSRDKR